MDGIHFPEMVPVELWGHSTAVVWDSLGVQQLEQSEQRRRVLLEGVLVHKPWEKGWAAVQA